MAEITVKNPNLLNSAIRAAISKKMEKIFKGGGEELMLQQAKVLRDVFANSDEFQSLKGKLKGEFGFTNEEVAKLDRILDLLLPNNEVTVSRVQTSGGKFLMQLEWVDFRKLKEHEFAQHELTRLDAMGRVVDITDVISWVEWLEEGATIRGYSFSRVRRGQGAVGGTDPSAFSRSGEGIMKRSGGIWTFQPTRIFHEIANDKRNLILKKGFGVLVKTLGKA